MRWRGCWGARKKRRQAIRPFGALLPTAEQYDIPALVSRALCDPTRGRGTDMPFAEGRGRLPLGVGGRERGAARHVLHEPRRSQRTYRLTPGEPAGWPTSETEQHVGPYTEPLDARSAAPDVRGKEAVEIQASQSADRLSGQHSRLTSPALCVDNWFLRFDAQCALAAVCGVRAVAQSARSEEDRASLSCFR